jgi:hypothetical protein
MERITVAAVSTRNEIGQANASIDHMRHWIGIARDASAELVLFPELNVCGYIPGPVASDIAEPVPGPCTEEIIRLMQDSGMLMPFTYYYSDIEILMNANLLYLATTKALRHDGSQRINLVFLSVIVTLWCKSCPKIETDF